eukprot:131306_1
MSQTHQVNSTFNHSHCMDNKLVILLGIVDYNTIPNETQTKPKNLYGIRNDINAYYKLWTEQFGYDIFPDANDPQWFKKENWTKQEVDEFLNESRIKLLNNKKYNGLIICLSGHGNNNNCIISSNGELINIINGIQNKFKNVYNDNITSRICIVDACCNISNNDRNSHFVTISCNDLCNNNECFEDPTIGGIFTQTLIGKLKQKPDILFSSSLLPVLFDYFQSASFGGSAITVERGLKQLELDHGLIRVRVKNGNDIVVDGYHISEQSDELKYEKDMVGIVLYQYNGQNKWNVLTNNNKYVECKSGYIIIVNKDKLDHNTPTNDNFGKLYQYRFGRKLRDAERNKFIGSMFEMINGTFIFSKNCIGNYYKNKKLDGQIFDKFHEMSEMERMAIRHVLEFVKQGNGINRNLLVKDMIKEKYKNSRTWNIRAFKPLIEAQIDKLCYDLFATQHLTEFRGIKKWGSNKTDCGTSSKVVDPNELSLYFKSSDFQECEYDPFEIYGFRRHLRRLFVFGDGFIQSEIMKLWNNQLKPYKKPIRIIDLCNIARQHKYTIDKRKNNNGQHFKTRFKGQKEIDYAIYLIHSSKQQNYDEDSDDEEDVLDRAMSMYDLKMDENDDMKQILIDSNGKKACREKNVSIGNGCLHIQSINGKHQFNIETFEMSRFSDPIDFKKPMVGMVLYLYKNNGKNMNLGDIQCNSGYVYIKTRDHIQDIRVMRNTWHDKLFKSLFNQDLSGKIFGR